MELKLASNSDVVLATLEALRLLDDSLALESPEAIAAVLRRVGSILCPAPPRSIVRAAVGGLVGLVDGGSAQQLVEEVLEAAIAYGDFLESESESDGSSVLRVAVPAFVRLGQGRFLLVGLAPDNVSTVPESLTGRIEYREHVRFLQQDPTENLAGYLVDLGLLEVSQPAWLRSPRPVGASDHLALLDAELAASERPVELQGLRILDSTQPVTFYKGRWREPAGRTGDFVARRARQYGADIWCYVRLDHGVPMKLLDLPLEPTLGRGCDEAWRLQCAVDFVRGTPQQYRVSRESDGSTRLHFFSPLPRWAQRRLDVAGQRGRAAGSLYSYDFDHGAVEPELQYLEQHLWMTEGRGR